MTKSENRWLSVVVGIIIGIIITLLIVAFLYYTRSFVFVYCNTPPICTDVDYINDPGDAISEDFEVDDILSISNNEGIDIMEYKRPPLSNDCVPTSSVQTVVINNPQYCLFTDVTGNQMEIKNTYFGSSIYSNDGIKVLTNNNCIPLTSEGADVISGKILLKWDPS